MDEILTVREVAEYIKMNERTVLKLAQQGMVPAAKIANQWRFRKDLLDAWLADQMEHSDSKPPMPPAAILALSASLRPELMNLELQGRDRAQILSELVTTLTRTVEIANPQLLLRRLEEREAQMSTAIGDGVALPHTRPIMSGIHKEPLVVFGISRRGVDYEALDGKPVHLFFLLCAPNERAHLFLLAKLNLLLRSPDNIETLATFKTPEEVTTFLKSWEKRAIPFCPYCGREQDNPSST